MNNESFRYYSDAQYIGGQIVLKPYARRTVSWLSNVLSCNKLVFRTRTVLVKICHCLQGLYERSRYFGVTQACTRNNFIRSDMEGFFIQRGIIFMNTNRYLRNILFKLVSLIKTSMAS